MVTLKKDRSVFKRIIVDIVGFGLVIISPFTGILPGPGGIPIFLVGLGLIASNHQWAVDLLHDFEKRRVDFTNKVLLASPKISRSIDIVCIVILTVGAYLALTQDNFIARGIGLFSFSISLLLVLSNQKRFERLGKWYKNQKLTS